ncbi:rRNA maturation RNase YbeY [Profundibacter amoris]|uniref:Endoribonuclease YbeY n=1 Tax=Profundibacter amoris TaxID=2171755 RepID=A0A347ULE4_9RHOB|nr:rRNA maturation RNase YbeY [Profundibacter amoris]AXX99672.1 rRNA maturation RNase YbeY [Profundibacter amoris]
METDLVGVNIEDERWHTLGIEALAQRACAATLQHLGIDPQYFEISLLACDDTRIADLNAEFRGKPAPTNVLSWPAQDRARPGEHPLPPEPDPSGMPEELGDIAISYDTCAREAAESGKDINDHVTHLLVHGVLHLLGYDHISDQDAAIMERLEGEVLGKLGISDPYRVQDT